MDRYRYKHGHSPVGKSTPTYNAWANMLQRCTNPENDRYADWGGRGVSVCSEWRTFVNFLADMGEKPEGMTLERKDVNGNYEPTNCVWASRHCQARNKRNNRWFEVSGQLLCLNDALRAVGLTKPSFYRRVREGMSDQEALLSPKRRRWDTR